MGIGGAFAGEEAALGQLKKEAVNFHQVVPGIYRSGLIPKTACQRLKEAGIKTVISFDNNRKRAQEEEERLKSLGISVIQMPWSGWEYPKEIVLQLPAPVTSSWDDFPSTTWDRPPKSAC